MTADEIKKYLRLLSDELGKEHLKITSADQVFATLAKYYPNEQIRPATKFFIEELLLE